MKHSIYEVPKIHLFIRTLEKVKGLGDNLDEYIEITSQLEEDGKIIDAYYYSAKIYYPLLDFHKNRDMTLVWNLLTNQFGVCRKLLVFLEINYILCYYVIK